MIQIPPDILEQIELELSYSEAKYPNQKLDLDKAVSLVKTKLSESNNCSPIPCFTPVNRKWECSRKFCRVCKSYASIALLIKGLKEVEKEKLNERERYILMYFTDKIRRKEK
jgi:hypothetical protein